MDGPILGTLRAMAGRPAASGLPPARITGQAGDALGKLITGPASPGGG